jgi:hypothetical protein
VQRPMLMHLFCPSSRQRRRNKVECVAAAGGDD